VISFLKRNLNYVSRAIESQPPFDRSPDVMKNKYQYANSN